MTETSTLIFRPEDILISVFHYFPPEKRKFSADRENIHTAFYRLKKEYQKLLKEFTFNPDKIFPTSGVLDQALNNLEFSRYLTKFNPYLERYEIQPVLDSYFDEKLKEEFLDYIDEIKSISEQLQNALGL
ncbi:MAG TPA: hypothetical protein ACFYD6_05245 [Candidatus Brocadiia bacterium]|nr:hypothetical protein [Candidatus Brocadiales bacterium]